jgi:hypothetical protein
MSDYHNFRILVLETPGKCSRAGKAWGRGAIRNSRRSSKCNCPATFKFDAELGIVYHGEHNEKCTELDEKEFQTKGYVMRILQSPDTNTKFENIAVTCLSEWGSSSSNVAQILEEEIMKDSYPLTQSSSNQPPRSYIKSIINSAKRKINGKTNPKDTTESHPDSIRRMCEKKLEELLPIVVNDERCRAMFYKCIEEIKTMQANDALRCAQARHKALGYNPNTFFTTATSSSVSVPPLGVANNSFDRGQKRKTSGEVVIDNTIKNSI